MLQIKSPYIMNKKNFKASIIFLSQKIIDGWCSIQIDVYYIISYNSIVHYLYFDMEQTECVQRVVWFARENIQFGTEGLSLASINI